MLQQRVRDGGAVWDPPPIGQATLWVPKKGWLREKRFLGGELGGCHQSRTLTPASLADQSEAIRSLEP